ncbi:polysaccharide deacetylase family protein [Aquabacterium sp.]|uniref:polysaccharide deacetylase family protein n=1 Tax=Aquabacterium sp. TaxID=1872578 RepID=UPI002E36D54C|nr:polysaccharide deacetylase family protein [Aquabacterium sp.]
MPLTSLAFIGAGGFLSPGGASGCLTVLTYHRVLPQADPLQPPDQIDAASFDGHMTAARSCFNVLPLPDALDMLEQGKLPRRALSITFDDGYEDNHSVALPILRRHRLPATFFICTGYLGNGLMFNDVVTEAIRRAQGPHLDLSWLGLGMRPVSNIAEKQGLSKELVQFVKYLPLAQRQATCDRLWEACAGQNARPPLMMVPEQVKDLAAHGMAIGGHTHTHPILTKIGLDEAREDIVRNRQALRDITGSTPSLFAYPNGRPNTDYTREHRDLVKEAGYRAAVSTAWGVATRESDIFQLPRFAPWNVSPTRLTLQLLKNAHKGRQAVSA